MFSPVISPSPLDLTTEITHKKRKNNTTPRKGFMDSLKEQESKNSERQAWLIFTVTSLTSWWNPGRAKSTNENRNSNDAISYVLLKQVILAIKSHIDPTACWSGPGKRVESGYWHMSLAVWHGCVCWHWALHSLWVRAFWALLQEQ